MPTAAVTALASALGVAAGLGARTLLLAAAVLAGQASVGWSNDWIDAARDLAVDRRDKPVVSGEVSPILLARCAAAAFALCVPLSFALGWRAAVAHLVAVLAAWTYNLGVKRTALSPAPYALAFGLLPVVVALALPSHPWPRWPLVVAGATLGVAGHLANTVGDVHQDAATGVRGLPQRLGPDVSTVAAGVLVAATALLVLATAGRSLVTVAAALVGVAVALACPVVVLRLGRRDLAFGTVVGAVALLVAAFVVSGGHRLVAT
jgi:4-hydroxybenzoate polyprenyltransferase